MRPGRHSRTLALVLLSACLWKPAHAPAPSRGPARTAAPPVAAPVTPPAPAVPPRGTAKPPATTTGATPVALPPIPAVDGPLNLHVVYPSPNQLLTTRDSNFIFGSTGSGAAQLTINGVDVPVLANGAFFAWLAVPRDDALRYELRATKGDEVATSTVPIRVHPLPMPLPDTGKLVVDRTSVVPTGELGLRGDERVRVAVRAPENASVMLHAGDGTVHAMTHEGPVWSTEVDARDLAHAGTIVVRRGRDTVELKTAAVTQMDATPRRYVSLLNADLDAANDTDEVSILRPTPDGTYKWFPFPGTVVELTGIRGASYRVRLDSRLEAWVDQKSAKLLDADTPRPQRMASNSRVIAHGGYSDLRIPVTGKPAYQVQENGDVLVLTLYGTTSNVDIVNFAPGDSIVRDVIWEQDSSDRIRFTIRLRHPVFGWLAMWDRGAFVLRMRRTPAVDARHPLAGRVIAVDPGHPPIGATGPTGLYEGDAVLAVAEKLRTILEERGATVVMTRTTADPVPLGDRPVTARRANAEAFVSVHLNAYPDGVNPLRARNGTNTYFFFDHAEPLARDVQHGLVSEIGLPDMGVNYDNLAVARQSWMPAILCEGAFVILPEQEAALRDDGFQRRYATGIADGLEEYFRSLAGAR